MKRIIILIVVFLIVVFLMGAMLNGCFDQKQKPPKSEEEIIKEKLEQRTAKEPLRIGVITDAHAYGKEVNGNWEINWRSKEAVERFVEKMNNEFAPSVAIDIGDLIDGRDDNPLEDWELMDKMIQKLKMPYFYTLGNHETRNFEKSVWLELTGYEKTYYYKNIEGYRLIILDANNFPNGEDTAPEKEYYPGALDDNQWQWIESALKNAAMSNRDPIVFIHQPPVSTDLRPNWKTFPKGKELHALFDKYKVRAVFSGHTERLCTMRDGNTEYFILQGMWKSNDRLKREYRFKDAGNFYYVTVTADDVKVEMEHRVFDDTMKKGDHLDRIKEWKKSEVTENIYNCYDGEQLLKNRSH